MIFNLNKTIKKTDGTDVLDDEGNPAYLWKLIAPLFSNSVGKGAQSLKLWGWAIQINKHKTINIDDVDRKYIKEMIENNKELPTMYQAQILEAIDPENAEKAENANNA